MHARRFGWVTLACAMAASLAGPAGAALFAFNYSGAGTAGQGYFTTNDVTQLYLNRPAQLLVGISGSVDGLTITSLIAPGGYDNNDNRLFQTGAVVDANGISFNYGAGNKANIYLNSSGTWYIATNANARSETLINLAVMPAPEPATWAMMIAGFGAVGAALRRRPRRTGAPSLAEA